MPVVRVALLKQLMGGSDCFLLLWVKITESLGKFPLHLGFELAVCRAHCLFCFYFCGCFCFVVLFVCVLFWESSCGCVKVQGSVPQAQALPSMLDERAPHREVGGM